MFGLCRGYLGIDLGYANKSIDICGLGLAFGCGILWS